MMGLNTMCTESAMKMESIGFFTLPCRRTQVTFAACAPVLRAKLEHIHEQAVK